MSKHFETFTEIIAWLQIVASPFLFASIIGLVIYFQNQSLTNLIIAIVIALIGLFVGIIFATKKLKTKKGTVWFVSRIIASPELDEKEKSNE